MSVLDVPGAQLYYEIHGAGPLLVLVPGAPGNADVFRPLTEQLAEHYTVVLYDRRGFSRSTLVGAQDYEHRLRTDADDLRRLIEHVGTEPATVFGSSSGGVVVLELLTRHPDVVRTLAVFEPAAMRFLPDAQRWLDSGTELYDLYRRAGPEPALEQFREQTFPESDRRLMARGVGPRKAEAHAHANATYWFERELRQYTAAEHDLDALRTHGERIVLLTGRDSRGYPAYEVNIELGKKLGLPVAELPGGHIGYASRPADFAQEFRHVLSPISR